MIEVKTRLYDAQEIVMFAQLEAALEQKRNMQYGITTTTPPAPEPAPDEAPAPAPSEPAVDDVAMQRAITQFAQAAGVPAARELLTEFGVSKVGEIPVERRAEFLARLKA